MFVVEKVLIRELYECFFVCLVCNTKFASPLYLRQELVEVKIHIWPLHSKIYESLEKVK